MSLKLKLAYKGQEHTATVPLGAFFGDLKVSISDSSALYTYCEGS